MAVVLEQTTIAGRTSNGAGVTAIYGATPPQGNILLYCGARSVGTVGTSGMDTSDSGTAWTKHETDQSGDSTGSQVIIQISSKHADASQDTSIVTTLTGTDTDEENSMIIYEVSGLAASSAFDVSAIGPTDESTRTTCSTGTTATLAQASSWAMAVVSCDNAVHTNAAWDNSFILEDEMNIAIGPSDQDVITGSKVLSATTGVQSDYSQDESEHMIAAVMVFKQAGAPPAGGATQYITLSGEI